MRWGRGGGGLGPSMVVTDGVVLYIDLDDLCSTSNCVWYCSK